MTEPRTYEVGEVLHIAGDLSPCLGCGEPREVHLYVVVSDKKMAPRGCDGVEDKPCPCAGFRSADKPGPPSREETWANYPQDAASILKAADSPSTRCAQPLCKAPIWWGTTRANNRRCPFDIKPDGTRTGCSHWRTCRDRPTKGGRAA